MKKVSLGGPADGLMPVKEVGAAACCICRWLRPWALEAVNMGGVSILCDQHRQCDCFHITVLHAADASNLQFQDQSDLQPEYDMLL